MFSTEEVSGGGLTVLSTTRTVFMRIATCRTPLLLYMEKAPILGLELTTYT